MTIVAADQGRSIVRLGLRENIAQFGLLVVINAFVGAMVGMELVVDRSTKEPDKALTGRLLGAALERGVILLSSGTYGNTIRVLAPLTTPDEVIEEGLDAVEQAMEAVS